MVRSKVRDPFCGKLSKVNRIHSHEACAGQFPGGFRPLPISVRWGSSGFCACGPALCGFHAETTPVPIFRNKTKISFHRVDVLVCSKTDWSPVVA